MQNEYTLLFQPIGRKVQVMGGMTILEAASLAGLELRAPCGGQGTCGKCRVKIAAGEAPPVAAEKTFFAAEELAAGWRLACRSQVIGDLTVEVPEDSLLETAAQILLSSFNDEEVTGTAAVRRVDFCLSDPTEEDAVSDLDRLEREVGKVDMPLPELGRLSRVLRSGSEFSGELLLSGERVLAVEEAGTSAPCLGVAFDLGTTTLVATLLDLEARQELGVEAEMNPQVVFGDDVIARITLCREKASRLADMQQVVLDTCNRMVAELTEKAGCRVADVGMFSLAGNTTMQHIFVGLNPSALGEVPFPPSVSAALDLRAAEIGLRGHRNARLFVFPNIGGFVGGDTSAGILAHNLARAEEPTLFVDIGTNGEIALAHKGRILASSCAAGPAFEGARIVQGMRAAAGAIEKVEIVDGEVSLQVIGGGKPAGLCGTALIDATAELLRSGILDMTGRILAADEVMGEVSPALLARIESRAGDNDFLLASAGESRTGEALYLHQRDIRELQLASGAIRAGISIVIRRAGLEPEDLGKVLLAGGFGNYIRRENAQRMGLLPDIPVERILFVGNAASTGAKAVLLARELQDYVGVLARETEHVDLSLDPEFQMEFGMAMMFPGEESWF